MIRISCRIATGILATIAVVLSSCGSDRDGDVFDPPAAGPGDESAANGGSNDVPDVDDRRRGVESGAAELTHIEVDELLVAYQEFLYRSDSVRLGDEDETESLADVAAPDVVAAAADWSERHDVTDADSSTELIDVVSWSNPVNVTGSTTGAIIHDCVEEEITTDFLDHTHSNFVDQLVMMRHVDGDWFVDEIQVRHDGTGDGSRLGCIPYSHAERVEATTARFLDLVEQMWARPGDPIDELTSMVEPALAEELTMTKQQFLDDGIRIDAPQEHGIEVDGSDAVLGDRTFVVGVCTRLPEGMPTRSIDSDEIVDPGDAMPSGFVLYREFAVRSETTDAGTYRDVVVANTMQQPDADCSVEGS